VIGFLNGRTFNVRLVIYTTYLPWARIRAPMGTHEDPKRTFCHMRPKHATEIKRSDGTDIDNARDSVPAWYRNKWK
jgi:hypothetical protein